MAPAAAASASASAALTAVVAVGSLMVVSALASGEFSAVDAGDDGLADRGVHGFELVSVPPLLPLLAFEVGEDALECWCCGDVASSPSTARAAGALCCWCWCCRRRCCCCA